MSVGRHSCPNAVRIIIQLMSASNAVRIIIQLLQTRGFFMTPTCTNIKW